MKVSFNFPKKLPKLIKFLSFQLDMTDFYDDDYDIDDSDDDSEENAAYENADDSGNAE